MEDVVGSVFDLMGRTSDPILEEEVISERVDTIFEVSSLVDQNISKLVSKIINFTLTQISISNILFVFRNWTLMEMEWFLWKNF